MKIWHVGACSSPAVVNGVNALVYTLAEEQLRMGDGVSLLLNGFPDDEATAFSHRTGAVIVVLPKSVYQFQRAVASLLKESTPDIVHMHSVFVPRHALLARLLRKAKVPYVLTPHGGYSPQVLARDRLKKRMGSTFSRIRCTPASQMNVVPACAAPIAACRSMTGRRCLGWRVHRPRLDEDRRHHPGLRL